MNRNERAKARKKKTLWNSLTINTKRNNKCEGKKIQGRVKRKREKNNKRSKEKRWKEERVKRWKIIKGRLKRKGRKKKVTSVTKRTTSDSSPTSLEKGRIEQKKAEATRGKNK